MNAKGIRHKAKGISGLAALGACGMISKKALYRDGEAGPTYALCILHSVFPKGGLP